jgi:glycerophosphoryl diester phosphodiesterase
VVVAHRGLSAGFPENTLAAFRNAIAGGVDAIELDLRRTADNEIVVLHDETVDRTTDGRGPLSRLTLQEVRALDAGRHAGDRFTGERIPTYQEVLELTRASGVELLLDIKESDRASHEYIVSLTSRHEATGRVIVGARSVDDLRAFRALRPGIRALGFIPEAGSIEAFDAAGVDLIRLWPQWIDADPGLVERVHALGRPVWVTAGTLPQDELQILIRRGVDGILTDLPEVLLPLVADLRP